MDVRTFRLRSVNKTEKARERENEVKRLEADGLKVLEIARILNISPQAVYGIKARIEAKTA